ncbi:ATP-dependent Zn protease [Rhizobium sp. KVB221]|uniref:ATP-dependent Zn protease n=1 Tax=Rhizobium setariae TaxID=2801340 RepID=A0A936YJT5_9HYPH|nr:ATP-dependent Zn protease [Rhizobium setariae]MBL0370893.1 ATP-dependent Zn protease [Rhizobium setariae]
MPVTPQDRLDHAQALRPLALLATGSTGADIERLVREARARARRERRSLTWQDIERSMTASARPPHATLDWQIAVHELGHAVVCTVLGIGTVSTIRIGGRGGQVDTDLDVTELQDEDGLMKLIAATLAGRAAEKIVLGKVGIGAGGTVDSDLARATQLALEAETSLGLGEEMPLLYRPPSNGSDMLNYDPNLARRVNRRLEAAEQIALGILERHRDIILSFAKRLCGCRVMEGIEVLEVIVGSDDGSTASETAIQKSE